MLDCVRVDIGESFLEFNGMVVICYKYREIVWLVVVFVCVKLLVVYEGDGGFYLCIR